MELVDLRMGALKRTKSAMVYTLGKLRRELEDLSDGRRNPNVEEDEQSAPYAAFLVDNCETAARNIILACSDAGWGNLIGEKLREKVKLSQTRATEFHREMVNWWEQLAEESVVTPARDLDETMKGLEKLMSMASAV